MELHAAFLRAINVGGRRVQMDRLRECFGQLGFSDVDMYRASGNVVFGAGDETRGRERRIEKHLDEKLGFDVPAFVRTLSQLDALTERTALEGEVEGDSKRYIVFLKQSLVDDQKRALEELQTSVDQFRADGRVVFWHRFLQAGESMPTSELESALNVVATRRTLATVERLVETYG